MSESLEHLSNYQKDERPWGYFERFTLNEATTAKIITVNAGEAFSLQTHTNRSEFWRVVKGGGVVTIGESKHQAQVGDAFFIKQGEPHRAEAGLEGLQFLEISFGNFDEQDIKRLEDRYGRT